MDIKHLFFDLDHTLWDFKRNSRETLLELFEELTLSTYPIPSFTSFYDKYIEVNDELWEHYRKGTLSKSDLRAIRFVKTFEYFGIDDKRLAEHIGVMYIARCPLRGNLFSNCHEVLEVLQSKYTLHIITNGFEEVQAIKMSSCNLTNYFTEVISSEKAGVRKPHPTIFEFALATSGARASESVMIGDSIEIDCIPAEKLGMKSVFFNPEKKFEKEKVSYEIAHLKELLDLF